MMAMGAMPMAQAADQVSIHFQNTCVRNKIVTIEPSWMKPYCFVLDFVQSDTADEPKEVQTEFTVKLTAFDDSGKVKLIKEIKNIVEGLNLVQVNKTT